MILAQAAEVVQKSDFLLHLQPLGYGLIAIGAAIGIGILVNGALQAIARQPEAEPKIKPLMFVGAALIEGFALIALVFTFISK
jgi:F-type H+-transporting ATPase subunit c